MGSVLYFFLVVSCQLNLTSENMWKRPGMRFSLFCFSDLCFLIYGFCDFISFTVVLLIVFRWTSLDCFLHLDRSVLLIVFAGWNFSTKYKYFGHIPTSMQAERDILSLYSYLMYFSLFLFPFILGFFLNHGMDCMLTSTWIVLLDHIFLC